MQTMGEARERDLLARARACKELERAAGDPALRARHHAEVVAVALRLLRDGARPEAVRAVGPLLREEDHP